MSQSAAATADRRPQWAPLLLALLAAVAAVATGRAELLALVAAAPVVWACLQRPDMAVIFVVAVLYTNAAVVAVTFHGAPKVVGMAAAAPLLLALFHHLVRRGRAVVVTKSLPWLALFLLLQTFSFLLARNSRAAWLTMQVGLMEGLILYVLLTNVIRSRRLLQSLAWTVVAAGAFMGLISVTQWATGDYENLFGGFAQISDGPGVGVETTRGQVLQPRLCGPIGEKNRYAQVLLVLLPLAYCQLLADRRRGAQAALLIALALIGAGCVLTFSRGAMVAIAIAFAGMLWFRLVRPSHLAAAALACCLLVAVSPTLQKRLLSIPRSLGVFGQYGAAEAQAPDGAAKGRATAMLAAWRVFLDHPLLGVGPGQFNTYSRAYSRQGGLRAFEENREAHCLYLELAAENGALGLAVFLCLVGGAMWRLDDARRRLLQQGRSADSLRLAGFLFMLVAYLASALFLHMSYARYFWLMLALSDSASRLYSPTAGEEEA